MAHAIVAGELTRRFDDVVAVDRLSLRIDAGEIFAVVGPDGAGKTTLMRLICAALRADSGSLTVDGIDVIADPAAIQAAVGYMPQRFSLYPDLTVEENLRFYGEIFGVARDVFESKSRELLDDFELSPFSQRLAEALSGGMKQKLALACTLIHEPKTILLDEPTAGVDPVSRREFWKILARINASGTTIVVNTPYMDEAERASRVAFMTHGTILALGTPAELKAGLKGNVVEVTCADRRSARSALRDEPLVRSVEVFGDTLHALVSDASQAVPQMTERLRSAKIADAQLRTIVPSLEDVFVERLTA